MNKMKGLFDNMPKDANADNHFKMMLAMAQIGMGVSIVQALMEFSSIKLDKAHVMYLTGPIVHHKSQWNSMTPKWLYKEVGRARLQIIYEEWKTDSIGWEVSPEEITIALYGASMDAPMIHEYAQIYIWAGTHASARQHKHSVDEQWELMGVKSWKIHPLECRQADTTTPISIYVLIFAGAYFAIASCPSLQTKRNNIPNPWPQWKL